METKEAKLIIAILIACLILVLWSTVRQTDAFERPHPAWEIDMIKLQSEDPPGIGIYALVDDKNVYQDYLLVTYKEEIKVVKLEKKG